MYQHLLDTFVCGYCSRSFTRKYNLRVHIENCHLNSTTCCDVCQLTFNSLSGLQIHKIRGHNRNNEAFPECDLCGRVFKRKQNIVSHMNTIHLQTKEICCHKCKKSFTTQRNLKRHLHQIHNPHFEYLECDDCNKVFKGKHSLIAHIQAVHDPTEKYTSKCHICAKVYTNARNLKRHFEAYHTDRGEFKCYRCNKMYTTSQSLRRHARLRHLSSNSKENSFAQEVQELEASFTNDLICPVCCKSFDEEQNLRQHVKLEHSFTAFYAYCRASLLRRHHLSPTQTPPAEPHVYRPERSALQRLSAVRAVHPRAPAPAAHSREHKPARCNVCFAKLLTKESSSTHLPCCPVPRGALRCPHCARLFSEPASRELHARAFHKSDVTTEQRDVIAGANARQPCDVTTASRALRTRDHTSQQPRDSRRRPLCGICVKEFSSRKTLKRHMSRFHASSQQQLTGVGGGAGGCDVDYDVIEFSIQRHRLSSDADPGLMLSELCTTEMSDHEHDEPEWDSNSGRVASPRD